MTTQRIRERAAACFRLAAHPTATEGERAAALERGRALLKRYNIDPAGFEIPGQEQPRHPPFHRGTCAQCHLPDVKLFDAMCRMCARVAGHGGLSS